VIQRVGVLGRIAPEKGQLEFVRAVRKLAHLQTLPQFVIVGAASGEHAAYHRALLRESAGLNIKFTGWQDDVAAAFAGLDLLVVPSMSHDAAPRVILEAFSARVPVLACASGGIPELIQDGINGFLVKGSDPDQIANRLAEVLRLPASYVSSVTETARNIWSRNYTVEVYQRNVWNALVQCRETALQMSA
jgi:glycosyltransferase involved in cell wall biosynthesis